MNKAQFVRTRPLGESVVDVIAAAKLAGIRDMKPWDVYEARKAARNRAALLEVRAQIGAPPPEPEAEPKPPPRPREPPEPEPPAAPRRRRRALVPRQGTDIYRVHLWLYNYTRQHGRGPQNLEAIGIGTGIPARIVGAHLQALRNAHVITNVHRDMRSIQILRAPDGVVADLELAPEPEPEPQPEPQPPVAAPAPPVPQPLLGVIASPNPSPNPSPSPYLHQLQADLTRILTDMARKGVEEFRPDVLTEVGVRLGAMRDLLQLLADDLKGHRSA